MSFTEYVSPLIGRFVLAWYFVSQALSYSGNWDATIALLEIRQVPAAPALLAFAIVVMWVGAIALALGFQARQGALLLFAFTVTVAVTMHDFWKVAKLADRVAEYDLFARDIAIAGALLLIVGLGPGSFAIDNHGE